MGKKRLTIGLLYNPSSNWIAGAYYVQNLVHALNACKDEDKPVIKVYSKDKSQFKELSRITHYPYLRFRPYATHSRLYYFIHYRIQRLFHLQLPSANAVGHRWEKDMVIYPIHFVNWVYDRRKILGWIPDLQEKYLPDLFSPEELVNREQQHLCFIKNRLPIVFSSEDSRKSFLHFYPDGIHCPTFVLPFAVTHPDFSNENIEHLKQKFGINKPYLFCANQFWAHKNHLFLFKAFALARQSGLDMQLVCSGQIEDHRNPEYARTIRDFLSDHHLENNIRILGFIERTEQLCLMQNAYAVVQPSLFEGWSTVVEDAKRLNKFIFLSDLPVHREQNPLNVCYFNPHIEQALAQALLTQPITTTPQDYSRNVQLFGEAFMRIVNTLHSQS